jgi:hypothetical protein
MDVCQQRAGAGRAPHRPIYIGHSDIRTTYNRYGHLMPGDEAQAVKQLDRYFERVADAGEVRG